MVKLDALFLLFVCTVTKVIGSALTETSHFIVAVPLPGITIMFVATGAAQLGVEDTLLAAGPVPLELTADTRN